MGITRADAREQNGLIQNAKIADMILCYVCKVDGHKASSMACPAYKNLIKSLGGTSETNMAAAKENTSERVKVDVSKTTTSPMETEENIKKHKLC